MRSPVAPACTVRVSVVLTLQPRDGQEPCAGRDIFGSRKLAGTPEPGSSWSLSGRTRGPRRARWLLLVPVTAERLTLMSLLRVQGATESPVARVQPRWIQGIQRVDGVGMRKTYLLIDIRNIRLD